MNKNVNIVEINKDNIAHHPQAICFINPKHECYGNKIDWLSQQFTDGLRIKLLYLKDEKAPVGYIEYTPGEYCWRAVNAPGYMFIHCLWTNRKKYRNQGLASLLIKEVEEKAKDMSGVAVITSDNAFMATKDIFLKNSYKLVEESQKEQLLVKQWKEGALPSINDWKEELTKYKNLTILYSRQCPWVARFIDEVTPILKKEKLKPDIIELKTAVEAQKAPSLYSAFNLIYNGKLLADRYISTTRFMNIVKKEIKTKDS